MKKCVSAAALCASLCAALLLCCAITRPAFAQSLPSPWTARDIGAPALSGSATYSSGVFTIDAAGSDIWGSSDQFHFVYQQIAGDVDIIARVDDVTQPSIWSKAGVMIRSSLNSNAAHGSALLTAADGARFRRRLTSGANSASTSVANVSAPVWVRAVRSGSKVTAYWSSNGSTWLLIGSDTIALGTFAYVGIAVTSNDSSARTTATLSGVRVSGAGSAMPTGQRSIDIGSPVVGGSTTYSSGAYTIKAAGKDIWDTADQFHYLYQSLTGNGEVVARVRSLTNTNAWAKAGVMIRESLTAQSRHASVLLSAGNGYAFQRRPDTGVYSEHTSGGSGAAPGWVKLVRSGDLFTALRSADGTSWTLIGSDTIPMGDTVYVGLAVTSHNETTATTAVIDSVKITASTAANQPPAVSITSPANGATFTAPTTVTIAATASDAENRMASVDFYAGSTLILRDSTSPYAASWSPTTAGTYALTAVARDADGNSTTSAAVSVTVQTSTNRPPTVSLSTNGTSFIAPASITLTATASDPEGRLARVDFFNGSTRLASDTSSPYSFSWSNVAAGTYSLTAVAYDTAGASATSAAVAVRVSSSTTTTPPRYVVFTASADHATNVTKYVFKVYPSGANPATATPVATSDLGKPTPASNGDITVDRATFFNNLATGSYVSTVTAVGSGGETTSASTAFSR